MGAAARELGAYRIVYIWHLGSGDNPRGLVEVDVAASSLKDMGKKVLPSIGQRIVVAEAVASGLTVAEFAPNSAAHEEFRELARAVDKVLKK
ncbi:MAG: hypothetical protein ABSF54_08175 [Bryobacteraceae bacterium]